MISIAGWTWLAEGAAFVYGQMRAWWRNGNCSLNPAKMHGEHVAHNGDGGSFIAT